MIGSRIGQYEITAKLGHGGMGEVYRATDAKLLRDVAIKVLPQGVTQDADRLARFEREAQLLAQLQHPNIASVYGLEEADGTRALVMELIEGPTLADRLIAGPLPVEECLVIARQIVEALEAAHEKGIVHRDLKPQNIKAPFEGKVKVLDFGLAKAMDPQGVASASPGSQLAASPTLTLRATMQGVIMGTAAYMAPEQAAAGNVDHRADIWSFGVVLYEMLTGRRLFDGETVSHVLASVLKEEPDYSALPADLPPRIRRLLRRCLRKKARERLQSIGDARIILDEKEDEESRTQAATEPQATTNVRTVAIVGIAALALGVVAGAFLLAPRAKPVPPVRLQLAVPTGLNMSGASPALALSPDGRRLVQAVDDGQGNRGLLLRELGQLEPRSIDGAEGARYPFFSPDGAWIAFFDATDLVKIAVAGGKPIRLAETKNRSRGGVWGKDGYIYFSPDVNTGIERVSEAGGPVESVTELDTANNVRTHRWPDVSPDGELLIYTSDTSSTPNFYDDARIEAVRLGEKTPHVLVERASMGRMLTDDLLVYANGGNLFGIEIDRKTLEPRGKPVALEQDVATRTGSGAAQFAVSPSGAAVWLSGMVMGELGPPVWFDRDGNETPTGLPETLEFGQVALSPDGRRVVVRGIPIEGGGPSGRGEDLWVGDLERGTLTRLTFGEGAGSPVWTPDGTRIAYQRETGDGGETGKSIRELVAREADGSGDPEVLVSGPGPYWTPCAFSRDGRYLAFSRWDDRTQSDLWILPLNPKGDPVPFQATPADEFAGSISPDGKWLAYHSDESGRWEIYVRPFPTGSGKWQVSPGGGTEPHWSPVGGELFYRNAEERLMSVPIDTASPTFRAGTPRVLLGGTALPGGMNPKWYDVSPDGKRIVALQVLSADLGTPAVNYTDDWIRRARGANR